jgi:putative glutamine amidotransferase
MKGIMLMKPIIGICANYSSNDQHGSIEGLGLPKQEWQLLADDYILAIENAGGIPLIIPVTQNSESLIEIIDLLDGVLFTGGSDIDPQFYNELPKEGLSVIEPKRDAHELNLARKVLKDTDIPLLGICRGIQILNVVDGGTIYQDLKNEWISDMNHTVLKAPKYHPTHDVKILEDSRLSKIFDATDILVNSFNHQAVKTLGSSFEATMKAPDGLIEGIEMPGERFVVAVQWHPEMMIEKYPYYNKLFEAFVNECKTGIVPLNERIRKFAT